MTKPKTTHLALTFAARLEQQVAVEAIEAARRRVVVAARPGGAAPITQVRLKTEVDEREGRLRGHGQREAAVSFADVKCRKDATHAEAKGAMICRRAICGRRSGEFRVMEVAAAQIACASGELETNLRKIASFAERAKAAGAELVVFPENGGHRLRSWRRSASSRRRGATARCRRCRRSRDVCRSRSSAGSPSAWTKSIYNSQVLHRCDGNDRGSLSQGALSARAKRNASRPATSLQTSR